jgi:hypothetical protein
MLAVGSGIARHLAMGPRTTLVAVAGLLAYGAFLGGWWVISRRRAWARDKG